MLCLYLLSILPVELYVPPLPTAASTPSFRTRYEVRGRSQTGQKKKSSETKGSGKYKTNDIGKATTPSEEGKMDEEETSTDPGAAIDDDVWGGGLESGYGASLSITSAFGNAVLVTLVSLHLIISL